MPMNQAFAEILRRVVFSEHGSHPHLGFVIRVSGPATKSIWLTYVTYRHTGRHTDPPPRYSVYSSRPLSPAVAAMRPDKYIK